MLSRRQTEIVVLVGRDGVEWKTVSRRLGLHPSTVRAHVRKVIERLDLRAYSPRDAMVHAYYAIRDDVENTDS